MSFPFRIGVAVMLVASFALVFILEKSMTSRPGPETQSIFLKDYDPGSVINGFRDGSMPMAAPRSAESSGNWGFVSHRLTLSPTFVMRADEQGPLLAALQRDAEDRLKRDGATIVAEQLEKPAGFRIGYQLGASRGAIIVKPATTTANTTKLDITIQEMWSEALGNQSKKKGT